MQLSSFGHPKALTKDGSCWVSAFQAELHSDLRRAAQRHKDDIAQGVQYPKTLTHSSLAFFFYYYFLLD